MTDNYLYIFLDEGGNLDFSVNGSKYFSLSCIAMERPFTINAEMDAYKYDLIEYKLDMDSFHCSHDNVHIRAKVFEIIKRQLESFQIDSLIIEKCKTAPIHQNPTKFYPDMLGYLLLYVFNRIKGNKFNEVVIITDSIPVKRQRKAMEKSIKEVLARMLPKHTSYRILHHATKAHYGLQVVDYCNWAVFRKWEQNDQEHYEKIKPVIKTEFDIFQAGTTRYY